MNHLEAFLSDDAKRGRVWAGGRDRFRRSESAEGHGIAQLSDDKGRTWRTIYAQVAAMEGTVTWADEPKALTPAEALRALADGKCIGDSSNVYKMSDGESIKRWQPSTKNWCIDCPLMWHAFHIAPDPSQPAEHVAPPRGKPISEWKKSDCQYTGGNPYIGNSANPPRPAEPTKPPLKVGDRVRVVRNSFSACENTVGALGTVLRFNSTSDIDVRSDLDGISWCFDETDLEKIEAEPQVEHNNYCDRAGAYPRSHPCVRCQSDYLKRKQQEGK